MDTSSRQISRIVYRLKRQFSTRIIFRSLVSVTNDVQTGKSTAKNNDVAIQRAVVLPASMMRDFAYDLSYIAANKNFTYGGLFDVSSRLILIDKKDLDLEYTPTLNDRCFIKNEWYEVERITTTADETSFILMVKHLDSTPEDETLE